MVEKQEHNKIRQIAKDYETEGYKVVVNPSRSELPSFIKDYQPDIIATSADDNVIIEVKTRSDFATIDKLRDIADVINKRQKWRFELIVTGSVKDNQSDKERLISELDSSEIQRNLKEAYSILDQELYSSAFIICWASLESLARQLLLEDKKTLNNKSSLVLIKTLFSFGYVSRSDYDSLEKLFLIRNQIVHGYKTTGLNRKTVDKLLVIVEKLVKEKINHDK